MEIIDVLPFKELDIYLDTKNTKFLRAVYQHFEYFVKNYSFTPSFQTGHWNGKKSLFKKSTRSLPYGLLIDLIKFVNKNYKNIITLNIDDNIKKMFNGIDINPIWDLKYKPYYYQKETIISALKNNKGIFKLPTASGKSLVITYISKEILKNKLSEQILIIVPIIGLVKQFKEDMIDYTISSNIIGMVDKDHKEWNKNIVISTWQSLKNNINELERFNCVIVDEVHGVRGDVLYKILKNSNAFYRFGFTGTMPKDPLEILKVKSYIGSVLKSYKSSVLAEEGYISKCNVKQLNLFYKNKFKGTYSEIKNENFNNNDRLEFISNIIKTVKGSSLLLVEKIENEGVILENYLKNNKKFRNYQIIFLHGSIDNETRFEWQKKCNKENNVIIIATFGIFQLGINIKSLKYVMLCSSFKSSIRILQSIGRALRKYKNKENSGAFIFDINDQIKYLKDHGEKRLIYYEDEEFDIEKFDIDVENVDIKIFKQISQGFDF